MMNVFEHNLLVPVEALDDSPIAPSWWRRCDDWLERVGERFNPILVKETRQALKSRQFTITFVLLLLACWLWSIGGVAIIGPEIYYRPSGPTLFLGYYLILSFPLAIIVPFAAFRSLITEQEDNTYELLSITTLTPRQIVTGKLGSAVVQMMVYFSAVAPCLAFTYLLRGIDIMTMSILMSYVFFGSLGLSAIGLLLATLSQTKLVQVPLSVILLGALFLGFFLWIQLTDEFTRWGPRMFSDAEFLPLHLGMVTAYITSFALVVLAAAARLNFPGENGSSPLRVVMLVQQACFVGWMTWISISMTNFRTDLLDAEAVYITVSFLALYWWGMGAFMSGESPELSLRVKRRLPQSQLGRALLTWFFPGPGTGYAFALANLGAMVLLGTVVTMLYSHLFQSSLFWGSQSNGLTALWVGMVVAWGYLAAYLGAGNLIIGLLRKAGQVGMLVAVLIQIILPLIGMGVPLVIQMMSPKLRGLDYTLLQISNPFWTLGHVALGSGQSSLAVWILLIVPPVGLFVFALNVWFSIANEVRHVRILAPARVLEEEAELHPAPVPQPLSPWD